MPLSTDFPSVRVDIADEKKFLRGPHQDVGSVISKNCATIWIPLTEVNDRRGTVALYKNTHKQKLRKQIFISRENLINNEVSLQGVNLKSRIVIDAKPGDLIINVMKGKKLTNMRTQGTDENVILTPVRKMAIAELLSMLNTDEALEITPESCRLRKAILDPHERKRSEKSGAAA